MGERSLTYRTSGLPGDVLPRCNEIARVAHARELHVETLVDALGGDAYVRASSELTVDFAAAAERLDAALAGTFPQRTVFNAPEALRDGLAMWGAASPSIEMQREIKLRFDPKNTLAPADSQAGYKP